MRTTFLRKGIVATAMMMFFGVVVTLAQSKWAKSSLLPGEGARSGLRDLPGATLEVNTARFAMIRLLCYGYVALHIKILYCTPVIGMSLF